MEKLVFKKDWQPLFAGFGLRCFDDFFSYPNAPNKHSKRLAVPISLGEGPNTYKFFLKRFYYAHLGDAFSSLANFHQTLTQAQCEWENAHLLHRKGFGTFNPVCFGARTKLSLEKQSFIVTEPVQGRPLTEFVSKQWNRMPVGQRDNIITSLARSIREMHDSGIRMPDLYAWHIFLRHTGDSQWRFAFIDLHRMQPASNSNARRIRDLARLLHSMREEYFDYRIRNLLLETYARNGRPGGTEKFAGKVYRHAAKLSARRRTKKY